jgi:hypothetical protein
MIGNVKGALKEGHHGAAELPSKSGLALYDDPLFVASTSVETPR